MIGEYKNLKVRDWQMYLLFLPMFIIGILALYLFLYYKPKIILLFGTILFISTPIYYFYTSSKMKVKVEEDKVTWSQGKKKIILKYTDDLKVTLHPSFYSPKIQLDRYEKKQIVEGFFLSDFFKNDQEVKKFVDWLKTKNPNIIDEINWDSFIIKHLKF